MCIMRWSESAEDRSEWRGRPTADVPWPEICTGGVSRAFIACLRLANRAVLQGCTPF